MREKRVWNVTRGFLPLHYGDERRFHFFNSNIARSKNVKRKPVLSPTRARERVTLRHTGDLSRERRRRATASQMRDGRLSSLNVLFLRTRFVATL